MNCSRIAQALPLFVGRDLPEAFSHEISAHLEICSACREVEAELRESQKWLKAVPPPPFDEADYAAVRGGVWREVEKKRGARTGRRRSGRLVLAAAAGVFGVAFLAVMIVRTRPEKPTEESSAAARTISTGISSAPPVTERPAASTASSSILPTVSARRSAPPRESAFVKIEFQTPNPNVRVIWLVKSGESMPDRLPPSRNEEAS